jgi:hypothetical protein
VLGGVAEQVLNDPFEHPRVRADVRRDDLERELAIRHELVGRDDLAEQRSDVDRGVVRLRDAARQPLEIEEVADHAVEAPRVLGDPVREVARLAGFER